MRNSNYMAPSSNGTIDNVKIKLCLVAPIPPPYGGIANWVNLMKNYTAGRDDIEIMYVNIAPKKAVLEGRTLFERVVKQGFAMFRQRREIINCLKNKPDAVHITTSGEMALIRDILLLRAARRMKVRSVYQFRFGRLKEMAEKNSLEFSLIKKAMRLASLTVTIDKTSYETIKKYLPEVKVLNVPNPINLAALPAPRHPNNKSIVFLGWLYEIKGIKELLTAWDKIKSEFPDWTLNLIGPYKDEYLNSLKASHDFKQVIVHGEKEHGEAMEMMNDAEIFILPSHTEGFPNVVLEAMALAKPIIASAVAAVPEMLADDCGILVKPRSPEAIEEALKDLIPNEEKRNRLGQNAYKKVKKDYSIDIVYQKYKAFWLDNTTEDEVVKC